MTEEERRKRSEYFTPDDEISFNLIDKATVDRLRREGDIKLPPKKVDIPKDRAWNTKLMSSKLLQGIENGDSIPKISKSLMEVIGRNEVSAVRNARTMVTGAENVGRQDSYQDLKSQGVIQKKVWIATPDDRTRESHLAIDDEEVDIDAMFSNGCKFPGDPDCSDASEVWNCRCTMRTHIIGFTKDGTFPSFVGERDSTMHSSQIEEERARREQEEKEKAQERRERGVVALADLGDTTLGYKDAQREEILRFVNESTSIASDVYLQNASKMQAPISKGVRGDRAYYLHSDGRVHFKPERVAAGNAYSAPYETHFHEYAHNIDAINKQVSVTWRDEQGRSFEDVITGEWEAHFKERFGTDAMWRNFESNLDMSQGGVGAQQWALSSIKDWADAKGLARSDDAVINLRNQIREMKSDDEIRDFIKENIDIFNRMDYNSFSISKEDVTKFCEEIKEKHTLMERANLSDMFERFSVSHGGPDYPFGIGHGKKYAKTEGTLAKETFAEMFSVELTNPESLNTIKEYLPESYSAFHKILRSIKE